MTRATLAGRMRALEHFRGTRLLPETWSVVRVDGRGFSRLTEGHFTKPFDAAFHQAMVAVARTLLRELQGVYAYTESDEASVLLPRGWGLFDGRVEKVVSVAAGLASGVFTQASGVLAHFDARVWLGPTDGSVVDYFGWRQGDALRCALGTCCYWTLRRAGLSRRAATRELEGRSGEAQRDLLARHGVTFDHLPAWQRHGVGLVPETYEKQGFDPKRQQAVVARRRRLRVVEELPSGEAYATFLRELLERAGAV